MGDEGLVGGEVDDWQARVFDTVYVRMPLCVGLFVCVSLKYVTVCMCVPQLSVRVRPFGKQKGKVAAKMLHNKCFSLFLSVL